MSVRIDRASGQTVELERYRDESGNVLAGVDANGRFFGDASRMTLIAVPNVTVDEPSAATTNAQAIQTAIDGAAPGTTVRLPNDKFYCNQINITGANSGITIEGGPNTLIINRTGQQADVPPIVARAGQRGCSARVHSYTSGAGN
jgi:hypothetical protein